MQLQGFAAYITVAYYAPVVQFGRRARLRIWMLGVRIPPGVPSLRNKVAKKFIDALVGWYKPPQSEDYIAGCSTDKLGNVCFFVWMCLTVALYFLGVWLFDIQENDKGGHGGAFIVSFILGAIPPWYAWKIVQDKYYEARMGIDGETEKQNQME